MKATEQPVRDAESMDQWPDSVRFATSGLLSKWGFGDGDMLDDLLWDRAEAEGLPEVNYDPDDDGPSIEHEVLIRCVRDLVIPVLEQRVEVYEIGSIHNPIRAESVEGREIDDYDPSERDRVVLTPEFVDVPFSMIWLWYLEARAKRQALS